MQLPRIIKMYYNNKIILKVYFVKGGGGGGGEKGPIDFMILTSYGTPHKGHP